MPSNSLSICRRPILSCSIATPLLPTRKRRGGYSSRSLNPSSLNPSSLVASSIAIWPEHWHDICWRVVCGCGENIQKVWAPAIQWHCQIQHRIWIQEGSYAYDTGWGSCCLIKEATRELEEYPPLLFPVGRKGVATKQEDITLLPMQKVLEGKAWECNYCTI